MNQSLAEYWQVTRGKPKVQRSNIGTTWDGRTIWRFYCPDLRDWPHFDSHETAMIEARQCAGVHYQRNEQT